MLELLEKVFLFDRNRLGPRDTRRPGGGQPPPASASAVPQFCLAQPLGGTGQASEDDTDNITYLGAYLKFQLIWPLAICCKGVFGNQIVD